MAVEKRTNSMANIKFHLAPTHNSENPLLWVRWGKRRRRRKKCWKIFVVVVGENFSPTRTLREEGKRKTNTQKTAAAWVERKGRQSNKNIFPQLCLSSASWVDTSYAPMIHSIKAFIRQRKEAQRAEKLAKSVTDVSSLFSLFHASACVLLDGLIRNVLFGVELIPQSRHVPSLASRICLFYEPVGGPAWLGIRSRSCVWSGRAREAKKVWIDQVRAPESIPTGVI